MAVGSLPTNADLDLNEVETNKELIDQGVALGYKKLDLLEQKGQLLANGVSPDNLQIRLVSAEIQGMDTQIDKVAEQWAEKKVLDIIKDPHVRAQRVATKKTRFLNKIEQLMKRQERREDRQERRADRKDEKSEGTESNHSAIPDSSTVLVDGDWVPAVEVSERLDRQTGGKDTHVLAVQRMLDLDTPLTPLDLVQGSRQREAISIVYAGQPESARLQMAISQDPGSSIYRDAIKILTQKQRTLEPIHEVLSKADKAQEDLEKATLEGSLLYKMQHVGKEFLNNPKAIMGAVGALVGLYLLKDKLLSEDDKKKGASSLKSILGWGLLGVGGIATIDFAWDKMSPKHRGLWDWLGSNPDNLASTQVLDRYREYFVGIPGKDKDSMDDMIRILDVDMPTVNDTFENALRNKKQTVDTRSFLGKGVDSGTESAIDGGSLYNGLKWFYGQCAERQLKEKGGVRPTNDDDYYLMGVNWARTNLKGHKFLSANYIVNIQDKIPGTVDPNFRPSGVAGAAHEAVHGSPAAAPAVMIQEPHLRELGQLRNFEESVVQLPSGAVLVKGYPFNYHFTAAGEHVFEDALDSTRPPVRFSSTEQGDSLYRHLSAIESEGETRAKKSFESLNTGVAVTRLRYKPNGQWELSPPLERQKPAGLGNYKENAKVPFVFFADAHGFSLGLELKEGPSAEKSFTSVEEIQKEFEMREVLPSKLKEDLSHLLLDLGFKVENYSDSGTQTTVEISYGSGHKGTVIYEGGVVKSVNLDDDAELQTRWEAAARKDTGEFFSNGDLQDSIIAVIGVDLSTNTTAPESTFNGDYLGIIGKTWDEAVSYFTDDEIETRYQDVQKQQIVKDLRDLTKRMQKEFVGNLYSKGYDRERFNVEKKTLTARYETEVSTILGKTTDIPLTTADLIPSKERGNKKMEEAFEPVAGTSWFNSSHDAFYNERLGYWQGKTAGEIQALFAGGASPMKSKVDAVINRNFLDASKEANAHYGKTAEQSTELLNDANFNGANKKEWKAAREKAYYNLTTAYKWEQYSFLSKPGNALEMMRVYDGKIDSGNPKPSTTATADDYTTYFLSEVYARLGGREDYSIDRLYGVLNSVSDTSFQQYRAALHAIPPYSEWAKKPVKGPVPPELQDSDGLHREQMQKEFAEWFAREGDPGGLTKIDGDWPQKFQTNVMDRAVEIISSEKDPVLREAKIVTLKKMVRMERYGVIEHMITNKIEQNKPLKQDLFVFFHQEALKYLNPPNMQAYAKAIRSHMIAHYAKDLGPNFGIPFY